MIYVNQTLKCKEIYIMEIDHFAFKGKLRAFKCYNDYLLNSLFYSLLETSTIQVSLTFNHAHKDITDLFLNYLLV